MCKREKELMIRIEQIEREHVQILEKRERQHVMQLEEKNREWEEKIKSLQNSMQAAQGLFQLLICICEISFNCFF
jgi:DNA repair exonuclease SbcCD ATPase subunit